MHLWRDQIISNPHKSTEIRCSYPNKCPAHCKGGFTIWMLCLYTASLNTARMSCHRERDSQVNPNSYGASYPAIVTDLLDLYGSICLLTGWFRKTNWHPIGPFFAYHAYPSWVCVHHVSQRPVSTWLWQPGPWVHREQGNVITPKRRTWGVLQEKHWD